MSSKLEPAICSLDTGQRIPYFDRCQLTIKCKSNLREGRHKPRVHVCQKNSWSIVAILCVRGHEQYSVLGFYEYGAPYIIQFCFKNICKFAKLTEKINIISYWFAINFLKSCTATVANNNPSVFLTMFISQPRSHGLSRPENGSWERG